MRALALLVLAAFALAACGGDGEQTATPAAGRVQSLDNVLALRSAFEADVGKTRLLVLFSPT